MTCASLDSMIAYALGEPAAGDTDALERHFFGCAACAAEMSLISSLGAGVRELTRRGRVTALATVGAVERARAEGARVRVYRLRPGETVDCTIARDDTFVVTRLVADLAGAPQVDVQVQATVGGVDQPPAVFEDVAADRESGELVFLWSGEYVKSLPAVVIRMRVLGRREGSVIGEYTLNHAPPA
jgi:anti-sigma factor RsiW